MNILEKQNKIQVEIDILSMEYEKQNEIVKKQKEILYRLDHQLDYIKGFKASVLMSYWKEQIKLLQNKKGTITHLNKQEKIKDIHMKIRDRLNYPFGVIYIIVENDDTIAFPLDNLTIEQLTADITWEQ